MSLPTPAETVDERLARLHEHDRRCHWDHVVTSYPAERPEPAATRSLEDLGPVSPLALPSDLLADRFNRIERLIEETRRELRERARAETWWRACALSLGVVMALSILFGRH